MCDDDCMKVAGGYAAETYDPGEELCVVVQTTATNTQIPKRTTNVENEVHNMSTNLYQSPPVRKNKLRMRK